MPYCRLAISGRILVTDNYTSPGPSTAGRTTSTTTSVLMPRERTSAHAVRYFIATHQSSLVQLFLSSAREIFDKSLFNSPMGLQTNYCRPQFYYAFRSLCPKAWTDRWDTQRGNLSPCQIVSETILTKNHRGWQLPCQIGLDGKILLFDWRVSFVDN